MSVILRELRDVHVPDPDRSLHRASRQQVPIGAEPQDTRTADPPPEIPVDIPTLRLPDPYKALVVAGGQPAGGHRVPRRSRPGIRAIQVVDQVSGQQGGQQQGQEQAAQQAPTAPDIVTLIVSPQDSITLSYLVYSGAKITLTLRNALDDTRVATEAATLQFLLSQYNIPVPAKLPYAMQPRIDDLSSTFLPNDVVTIPPDQ